MKYQPQHDLIDPDARAPIVTFEFDGADEPEPLDDAYVIREDGSTVRGLDAQGTEQPYDGPRRWAKPAAFILVGLFVVMTAWNVSHLVQGPPPPPKPSPFRAKQALYLGVMRIDAYRRVHGVVPESLAAAGLPEADAYAYNRVNPTRYVLSFRGGGSKLEYDSNDSKELFFGSPQDLLTMGDSK